MKRLISMFVLSLALLVVCLAVTVQAQPTRVATDERFYLSGRQIRPWAYNVHLL